MLRNIGCRSFIHPPSSQETPYAFKFLHQEMGPESIQRFLLRSIEKRRCPSRLFLVTLKEPSPTRIAVQVPGRHSVEPLHPSLQPAVVGIDVVDMENPLLHSDARLDVQGYLAIQLRMQLRRADVSTSQRTRRTATQTIDQLAAEAKDLCLAPPGIALSPITVRQADDDISHREFRSLYSTKTRSDIRGKGCPEFFSLTPAATSCSSRASPRI